MLSEKGRPRTLAGGRGRNCESKYSGNADGLDPDKLRLQRLIAVLQKHRDHFPKIGVEFIKTVCLGVRATKARNVSHEEARVRIALNHRCVLPHESALAGYDSRNCPGDGKRGMTCVIAQLGPDRVEGPLRGVFQTVSDDDALW